MKKYWKESEVEYLVDNWQELTIADIAKKLKRSIPSVMAKAKRLLLKPQTTLDVFMTRQELSKLLGISVDTIIYFEKIHLLKSHKLGRNKKYSQNIFYDQDIIDFLENNLDRWDGTKVANYFTFNLDSKIIQDKINFDKKNGFIPKRKIFSEKEHNLVFDMYKHGKTYEEIGKILNRTPKSISDHLYRNYKKIRKKHKK